MFGLSVHAHDNESKVSINAVVADEKIPEEAAQTLIAKMKQMLLAGGMCDNGYTERFVMTAKIDITQKDIVPSTPVLISEKIDITFFVGDAIANKLYESCTVSVAGIGTNENKVFISAFQKLNAKQTTVLSMLSKARADIAAYFTKHCDEILTKARTEAGTGNYQKAIFLLTSVPNVCEECYTKCQQQAVAYCRQQMAAETADLLNQAKTEWMKNPTAEGATIVADIIGKANPQSSNYSEVVRFRNSVSAKLQADAKRDWELKIKQYEDSQAFKRSLVETAKAVGVAWAQNQPTTIYKTLIRSWW